MLKPPRLSEIVSRDPVTVRAALRLSEAMALMKQERVTAVVVVEANRPIGILTERDVLRTLASGVNPETLLVGNIMTPSPITVSPDLDFFEAYHLCSSRKIRHLILVDRLGELSGVASESDFLRILGIDVLSDVHSVDQDMIRLPLQLSPDMPLLDVVKRMHADSGGAAIAVLDHKPIGILTERDAIRLTQENLQSMTLADVMSSPVLSIPLGSSIYYAIDQMRNHSVRHLVILNQEQHIVGLFTEHAVVKRIENRYIDFLSTVIERQINDLNTARDKLNDSAVLTSILRESLDLALVATDIEGIVRYLNPKAVNLLGTSSAEAEGRDLAELTKQAGLGDQHVLNGIAAAKQGQRTNAEIVRLQADGERVLSSHFAPIVNESATMLGYVQTLQDITERKRAILALKKSASIFENTLDGIMVTDAECKMVAVNPAFVKITGYSEIEVLGRNPRMLSSGRQDRHFYERMWHHVKQDGYWQGEIWNRHKSGDIYAEWLTINAIKDEEGVIVKYIGVFADITALKRSQEKYEFMAHHDPLTDLPNRLLCHARLEYALLRAKRNKSALAVMMLDLDNFKPVNDTWGHHVGDHVLQEVAKRMLATLRSDDTAGRLGGDEFVVILEAINNKADAVAIAGKLLGAISEVYLIENIQAQVSVSVGIAMFPDHGEDVETLLVHADQALYEVKSQGRKGYCFYEDDISLQS
jgi:diguanylate cyclase (GGDEF)-like protein/PAS domain S-box-containing protein